MSKFNPKQSAILDFLQSYTEANGRPPTHEDIRRQFGLSTKSLVAYHLKALETAGLIERTREVSRGIRLTHAAPRTISLPVYGTIQAGPPVESAEVEEAIELTRDIVSETDGLYGLRVRGDSMRDALVHDGDIVVLKHQREARNGEMVAVRIADRDQYTLKHFFRENGHVRLKAANPAYEDILLHPSVVEVQGRVVAVIRRMAMN